LNVPCEDWPFCAEDSHEKCIFHFLTLIVQNTHILSCSVSLSFACSLLLSHTPSLSLALLLYSLFLETYSLAQSRSFYVYIHVSPHTLSLSLALFIYIYMYLHIIPRSVSLFSARILLLSHARARAHVRALSSYLSRPPSLSLSRSVPSRSTILSSSLAPLLWGGYN